LPNLPSQSRVAFFRIASNTDLRSPGDLEIMLSTSDVAVCWSRASFSSRAHCSSRCRSSEAGAAFPRLAPAVRRRFGAAGLRSRAFGGFRLDPLRFFVACTMGPPPAASADQT
jgi:hypothetical protein